MIAEFQALKSAADQEAFQAWLKVNGARMQELQGESKRMQSKLKELRTAADAAEDAAERAADAEKAARKAEALDAVIKERFSSEGEDFVNAARKAATDDVSALFPEISLADLGAPVNTVDEC